MGRGKGRSVNPDREKKGHSVLVTKSERTDGPSLFYYIFRAQELCESRDDGILSAWLM